MASPYQQTRIEKATRTVRHMNVVGSSRFVQLGMPPLAISRATLPLRTFRHLCIPLLLRGFLAIACFTLRARPDALPLRVMSLLAKMIFGWACLPTSMFLGSSESVREPTLSFLLVCLTIRSLQPQRPYACCHSSIYSSTAFGDCCTTITYSHFILE